MFRILMMIALPIFFFATMAPQPAEAVTFSRPIVRVSPSVSTSTRISRPSTVNFHSVSRIKTPAAGGSNTMLYAAAYLAILNSQSHAAGKASIRDAAAISTYGVSNNHPITWGVVGVIVFFSFCLAAGFLILIFI